MDIKVRKLTGKWVNREKKNKSKFQRRRSKIRGTGNRWTAVVCAMMCPSNLMITTAHSSQIYTAVPSIWRWLCQKNSARKVVSTCRKINKTTNDYLRLCQSLDTWLVCSTSDKNQATNRLQFQPLSFQRAPNKYVWQSGEQMYGRGFY